MPRGESFSQGAPASGMGAATTAVTTASSGLLRHSSYVSLLTASEIDELANLRASQLQLWL